MANLQKYCIAGLFVLASQLGFTPIGKAAIAQKSAELSDVRIADLQSLSRPFEIRTRRLYLVRPDLMHFPIQYDIFC